MQFFMIEDDDYKASKFTEQIKSEDSVEIRSDFKSGFFYFDCNMDEIDCIILDMQFPNKKGGRIMPTAGKEFAEILKRGNIKIPIILFTGCSKEEIEKLNIKGDILMVIHFDPSYSLRNDIEEMYSLLNRTEGVK